MFNTVAKGLEADAGVVGKVLDNLILVEPSTIAVVESLRQVPVVQGLSLF